MSWFEDLTPWMLIGVALLPAVLLVSWLDFKLQQLPSSIGKRRRVYLTCGIIAGVLGMGSAYGLYVNWLQKPSADLLTLSLSYRFPFHNWAAGDEMRFRIVFQGGENHAQLLTRVLLKDRQGNEVTRQEKVLRPADGVWEPMEFRYQVGQTGEYRVDVLTPGFVTAVDVVKDRAGI